ncbi:MAG: translation initiation factor IF-3 [Candidatus Uhrbacteria bacterium]|nr:translation initiation factor IF-3 [Candidatus Uhrbacteria bacterium]
MRIHRHRRFQKPKFEAPEFKANHNIINPEIRVIDENGVVLGVMPTAKAVALATERGLDLIEVSPKAVPPVCKFADFGHFKYQKEKEMRKQRAQSKEVEIKGIRLSMRIGEGDLDIRVDQAKKFFEQGDKIKVEMILRGRERAHADVARAVFTSFVAKLSSHYPVKVEQPLKAMDGRMHMILARQS